MALLDALRKIVLNYLSAPASNVRFVLYADECRRSNNSAMPSVMPEPNVPFVDRPRERDVLDRWGREGEEKEGEKTEEPRKTRNQLNVVIFLEK